MNNTHIKRDQLLNDLKSNVIELFFENNQTKFGIRCTLRPDMIPAFKEQSFLDDFHNSNLKVIAAWDINDKRWRSFDADAVVDAQDVNSNY